MTSANPIRDKIVRTLTIYPKLSRSMLHNGIGPNIPSASWLPVLYELIELGQIVETVTQCEGRSYKVLSLAPSTLEVRQIHFTL